jgi:anti-anti-sigma regulatory factor
LFSNPKEIVNEFEENRIHLAVTLPLSLRINLSGMPEPPLHMEDLPGSRAGIRVLRLTGPLTLFTVFGFQSKVRADDSQALILDFTNVPLVGFGWHRGVGRGLCLSTRAGRILRLAGVNQRIHQALEVTRVESFFHFYGSVDQAEPAA